MPLTLHVGLSKKMGLPDYGSMGASCHVEVEVESSLLLYDPEAFQQKVRQIFAACGRSVHEELTRHQETRSAIPASNGNHAHTGSGNGTTKASARQLAYIRQLAANTPGLDLTGLDRITVAMFHKTLADLSAQEASSLIDTLKQIDAGELDLAVFVAAS